MKILYAAEEGGKWHPWHIAVPGNKVFAICLSDGTIWDEVIGVYDLNTMSKDEFKKLFKGEHLR